MYIPQESAPVENLGMHYGKFLSQLRAERGLTQVQLAEQARVSVDAVRQAEYAEHKRMFPRTFLSLVTALHATQPLNNQDLAHFGEWSGMSMAVLHATIEQITPASKRIIDQPELPPISASLSNAITACLLKMSQAQLADVLYEVAQTLTRAQLQHPLPPGSVKPTTITGPGLLGLQHPDDNGYQVAVYFEPREPLAAAAVATPTAPPKLKIKGPSGRRSG
jgi:transcriptional regulator with XRE-family HTH domain